MKAEEEDVTLVENAQLVADYFEADNQGVPKANPPARSEVPGQRGSTTQADTEQKNSDRELHTLWAEVIKAGANLREDEAPALTKLFPLLIRNKEHVYRAATLLKACFFTLMKNNIITAEGAPVGNAPLDGQLVLLTQHVKGYAKATLKCRAAVSDSRWDQFVVERYLHKLKQIREVPESSVEKTVIPATRGSTTQTDTEQNGSLSPAIVRSNGVCCTLQDGKFNRDTDELRTLWVEVSKAEAILPPDIDQIIPHFLTYMKPDHGSGSRCRANRCRNAARWSARKDNAAARRAEQRRLHS